MRRRPSEDCICEVHRKAYRQKMPERVMCFEFLSRSDVFIKKFNFFTDIRQATIFLRFNCFDSVILNLFSVWHKTLSCCGLFRNYRDVYELRLNQGLESFEKTKKNDSDFDSQSSQKRFQFQGLV